MLRDMIQSHIEESIRYEIVYDDGHWNGYGFPCDEKGQVKRLNKAAQKNYMWCVMNRDKFVRSGEVIKYIDYYTEPASGICHCGERIDLVNEYFGACECPNCGQWYNLFGQELKHPRYWME